MFKSAALIVAFACIAGAQNADKEPPKFYKLDFVVKDMDGAKVLTARNYSVIVSEGNSSEIRAGSKVPVGNIAIEIGTNIDCAQMKEIDHNLMIYLSADISSLLEDNTPTPVIRQNKWRSNVVVPLKKPTVVFSSDDNTTKRVLQLEVTATPRLTQ